MTKLWQSPAAAGASFVRERFLGRAPPRGAGKCLRVRSARLIVSTETPLIINRPSVIFDTQGEETVVIDLASGHYFRLDAPALACGDISRRGRAGGARRREHELRTHPARALPGRR